MQRGIRVTWEDNRRMRTLVVLAALGQGIFVLFLLLPDVSRQEARIGGEIVVFLAYLTGAILSLIAATLGGLNRDAALLAAGVNVFAIACFCLMPLVLGGEYLVGAALMWGTGLIVLPIAPPAINAVLLLIASKPQPPNPPSANLPAQ
jgi:hypothetical protein